MLNGLDPIIIFQFSTAIPSVSEKLAKIPLVSSIPTLVEQPPIPLYLNAQLTGLHVVNESKSIDANTQIETKTSGEAPDVNQKGVAAIVSVDLEAKKSSMGLSLLLAMSDLILEKLTSKEYFITYMHGATTVFRGLLHSLTVTQDANDDLMRIKFELSRGDAKNLPSTTTQRNPTVTKVTGPTPT